jgi:predicted Zn finger-like uncharacterized protein
MKITCQACAAKYTIADDKVQGKIVKIRCKKCGATIVVNGNDPSAVGAAAGGEAARFDYASQGGSGDQWTVNVADGDQRTLTDSEVVDAYHAGVVTDETFCWKDGMGDWLALREIEQLYAQCTATRAMPAPSTLGGRPAAGSASAGAADDDGDFATKVQESPLSGGGGGASRVPQPPANGYADAAPLAARRANARAPAADLFGSAAQAGSEEDVMTSAPQGMPQPHAPGGADDKLTGQRNENSVLFSLNALTSKGGPGGGMGGGGGGGGHMPAGSEASGLIDIRQLSNQIGLGEDKKKKSRIDDIMNLGGGGAFAPSLGAPIMSAPPIEEYAPAPDASGAAAAAPQQGKNRMVIIGAIGAGVLVIAGAIGIASMLMKGGSDADKDKAAASASALAMTSAAASASGAPASASAAPAGTDSTAAVASAAPTDSSTAGAAPTTTATAKPATTAAVAPTATAASTATAAAATTTAAAATTAPAATAAAAAAGGADQPFNMGAAKASLGGIAGGAQSCKKGDASGSGRATVTFAPSGAVQSVTVEGFESNAGTTACVSRMFRGARVPPFSGSPFSVRKSFSIN